MKGKSLLIIALLVSLSASATALEFGVDATLGNLNLPAGSVPSTFNPSAWQWAAGASFREPLADAFSLEGGIRKDDVLRNLSWVRVEYRSGIATIGFGPLFGVFNTTAEPLKPGLSASVRLEYPGVAFVSIMADSSLGAALSDTGDYLQEGTRSSVGFYVTNAICALNMNTRRYRERKASAVSTSGFTEYAFTVDIFKKNEPYTILLNFAYQERTEADGTTTAALDSLVLGSKVSFQASSQVLAWLDLESNIYSFGRQGLAASIPTDLYLFRVTAGTTIRIEKPTTPDT